MAAADADTCDHAHGHVCGVDRGVDCDVACEDEGGHRVN